MPEEATTSARDRTHSNAMETSPTNPTSPPIIIGPELTAPPPLEDEKMRKYFLSRLPLQRRRRAPDGKEEWDEVCFLWLKQTNEGRKLNLDPRAQLVCFTKKESTSGEDPSHVHMVVTDDFQEAHQHIKDMTQEMTATDESLRYTVDIDLTHELDLRTGAAANYISRLFRPHAELAKSYAKSWTDGGQADLIGRLFKNVFTGGPLQLANQCRKKWSEWIWKREG
ncbi:hypothetical protein HK097_004901 [Rhizophlyctis rosea]|uniref:Uncharacterized protein n=1 Tax=Rhizophlyctis rosea TaxID=64517 RepID=A0AAD5SDS5_9FUNG|nr:hypothetical protein HK097_004901 [Rhizophlyctis rosea]